MRTSLRWLCAFAFAFAFASALAFAFAFAVRSVVGLLHGPGIFARCVR